MKTQSATRSAVLAAAGTALASTGFAADPAQLITAIKSKDEKVRGEAWQTAAKYGPAAVKPLVELMSDTDFELARAAKRGLWKIVRHAGRPGAGAEANAVVKEIIPLLKQGDVNVRRELLWMLSEIGGDEAVGPMAALLSDPSLREDARTTLERIPGKKAAAALQSAFDTAPVEFKPHLAESLRGRGVKVAGYPSQKRVPRKETKVKPVRTL